MLSPTDLYSLLSILTNYDSRTKLATILLENDVTVKNFAIAVENTEETGWDNINNSPVSLGKTIEVEVQAPRPATYGKFYVTVGDFISDKSNIFKKPTLFYVHDIKYHPFTTTKIPLIDIYECILELNAVLDSSCTFSDHSQYTWFFMSGDESTSFSPILDKTDLSTLDLNSISNLVDFFKLDNIHLKQKHSILSKHIVILLSQIPFDQKYKVLLKNLSQISIKLENDYSLFASEFSYDKIFNQIENEKLEEQVKIHKVLTDIQTQILGIPVATVIIATQYKINNDPSSFWINLSILFGALIFTLLMDISAQNQKNTLIALDLELDRKQKLLESKFPKIAETEPFKPLKTRIKSQNIILIAIQAIVTIGFVVAFIFFLKISNFL